MNEVDFKNWLAKKNIKRKVQGDIISRLKRVERELNRCDLDKEYQKDRCESIKALFSKQGLNPMMKKRKTNLPVGRPYMSTYRHAIKRYVDFRDSL